MTSTTQYKANDLLGGLIPEDHQTKKPFLKNKGTLEATLKGYDAFYHAISHSKGIDSIDKQLVPSLKNHEIQYFYDLMNIASRVDAYSHNAISFYLSALINASPEHHVKFNLRTSVFGLCSLGLHFGNGTPQQLDIYGNAGMAVGCEMKQGVITIHGNATINTGHKMQGGTLIIKGTALEIGDFTNGMLHCQRANEISEPVSTVHAKTAGTINASFGNYAPGTIHLE